MNPGTILLDLAFATAVASGIMLFPAFRGRQPNRVAAPLYLAHAVLLLAAMSLLIEHFIAHRFQYVYVAQYSSRELQPAMAVAASWAGQEGSILLWAMFGALIGAALLRQPGKLTRPALSIVCLMQAFLLYLVLARDPFRVSAVVPADGEGLNPLLNDPWMVAHPPLLFLGYAALVVPFALAIAALARRAYDEWNRMVWPWALFAVLSLGVGIVLGGIWAYKVLGWGGYWGWDPVENASLVPWLVSIALLHGLLIQRATHALVRTNLLLATIGWLTVLGGTYLTRSGILSDFSVHSFADSGLNGPLTALLGTTLVLAVVMLGLRWREIPATDAAWTKVNRASALWVGLVTVMLLAVLVTLGTTAPLLTTLAGKPANVQPSFYKQVIVPLGFAILLFMALAPALRWSRQEGRTWLRAFLPGIFGGALVAGLAFAAGLHEPGPLLVAAAGGLALGMNFWMMISLFSRGWKFGAGYLGHFGIAVMALGMLVSGGLGKNERVRIKEGSSVDVLGHRVSFAGLKPGPMGSSEMQLTVAGRNWTFDARPRLLAAPRGEGMIHTPAISLWREIYVSPLELQEIPAEMPGGSPHGDAMAGEAPSEHDASVTWLEKQQEVTVGDTRVRFEGFRMASEAHTRVYADLVVTRGGKTSKVAPYVEAGSEGSTSVPVEVQGFGTIALSRIDADRGRVALHLPAAGTAGAASGVSPAPLAPLSPPAERFAVIELSTKPLINLVWIGALLMLVGTAMAGMRRASYEIPAPAVSGPAKAGAA